MLVYELQRTLLPTNIPILIYLRIDFLTAAKNMVKSVVFKTHPMRSSG